MTLLIVIVVALATYFDLKYRRIPNWLTYPAILSSFYKYEPIILVFIALGVTIALSFGKYVGSGDIKLGLAIAIWSHILSWSQYWIYASLVIGGLFGAIYRRNRLPFAPFMAAGILIANMARSYGFI